MADDEITHQWGRRWKVLFASRVSYIYHRQRQRFFGLLDAHTKAATVLMGATMLSPLAQGYLPWLGGAILGLGLLSLVFGYGDRKQVHRELAEAFGQLVGAIEAVGEHDFSAAQVNDWHGKLHALNAKEPPALYALVAACQNQINQADGHPSFHMPLRMHERLLMHWVNFDAASISQRQQAPAPLQ